MTTESWPLLINPSQNYMKDWNFVLMVFQLKNLGMKLIFCVFSIIYVMFSIYLLR